MIDSLISFPVEIDFKLSLDENRKNIVIKNILTIYPNWKRLTESIPLDKMDGTTVHNYGILTGKINNITVLDVDKCLASFGDLGVDTTYVRTPNGGFHKIFQYEPTLHTIYNIAGGISVYNDNACIFGGKNYTLIEDYPIAKMPPTLLQFLQMSQDKLETPMDDGLYELLSILPTRDFNDDILVQRIIFGMRNKISLNATIAKNTIGKLLQQRSDTFNQTKLNNWFETPMSSIEKKITLNPFIKKIEKEYPQQYEAWILSHRVKKSDIARRIKFKRGNMLRLSDIQSINNHLTAFQICLLDRRFEAIKLIVCKSCNNKHKVGCCNKYNRTNRTTATFIENARLIA
jgi:hypothetical protein